MGGGETSPRPPPGSTAASPHFHAERTACGCLESSAILESRSELLDEKNADTARGHPHSDMLPGRVELPVSICLFPFFSYVGGPCYLLVCLGNRFFYYWGELTFLGDARWALATKPTPRTASRRVAWSNPHCAVPSALAGACPQAAI